MTPLKSPYFPVMPARKEMVERLAELGIRAVRAVRLFKYSSCTPAFCVEIEKPNGKHERVVLRGEQQNDLSVTSPDERSIEKEIYMLKKLRALGVNAAEVLLDGQIHTVPGYNERGDLVGDFRFFLMEYVEGTAIDRRIHASSSVERLRLLDQVAAVYARVHSIQGTEYGLVDRHGHATSGHASLREFLSSLMLKKAVLAAKLLSIDFSVQIHRFCDGVLSQLCAELDQAEYTPRPRMVLYDGFCGNMLIEGERITLIDLALAGYFEAVTEFCALIFPLNALLLKREGDQRYWDHFVNSYTSYGGVLPPTALMLGLLHVMFVNLLVHNAIYCGESRGLDKRAKASQLMESALAVMAKKPRSIDDLIHMI